MSDLIVSGKLPAILSSLDVVTKLNEIRIAQGVPEKNHKNFLRDLDAEIAKLTNENSELNIELVLNIQPYMEIRAGKEVRSHVMMCEDTADMMLSKESPTVRVLMKRKIRELMSLKKTPMQIAATMNSEQIGVLLGEVKEKEKALAQAAYQDKALTTSQLRNATLTREKKKLEANLRGYQEFVSLSVYLSTENISTYAPGYGRICINFIVRDLKRKGEEYVDWFKQATVRTGYPVTTFRVDFLDKHKKLIESEILRVIDRVRVYKKDEKGIDLFDDFFQDEEHFLNTDIPF